MWKGKSGDEANLYMYTYRDLLLGINKLMNSIDNVTKIIIGSCRGKQSKVFATFATFEEKIGR